jgi:hypothetical protein
MSSYVIKNLLISIFIGTFLSALVWMVFIKEDSKAEAVSTPVVTPKQIAALPQFKVTALQLTEDDRQVVTCEAGGCESLPSQESDNSPAVTDGQSWYHYQTIKDRNDVSRIQLRRSWIDSDESDLIIEQTELVEPRGLYISPDNQKIAFWLDSTARGNSGLTELWIYSTEDGGTKLVAEKIKKNGVLTKPRWNRASTHLFFLGSTVIDDANTEAVHVIPIHTTSLLTPFTSINWKENYDLVEGGAVDIDRSGQALAYVEPKWNKNVLYVHSSSGSSNQTKVRGQVPYIQWITDDTLLYVVQGKHTFTFWKTSNGTHKHVAKYQGEFQSARVDMQGKYLAFNTKHADSVQRMHVLDIESGYIEAQGNLPNTDGHTYLIHLEQHDKTKVAGAIDQLDDDLIAGFIDKHFSEISRDGGQLQRFIVTDKPNTIFVDYVSDDKKNHRLLLNIQDITHVEWTIVGRFEDQSGEWMSIQGGGLSKPNPLRLYEWEEGVNQWILKDDFE